MNKVHKDFLNKLSELLRSYGATIRYFEEEAYDQPGELSITIKPNLQLSGSSIDFKDFLYLDDYQVNQYILREENREAKEKAQAILDEWNAPLRTNK